MRLLIGAALLLASCATADRGGWMVGDDFIVQHYATGRTERFVLQSESTKLAELEVHLARGEETMYGFECGSHSNTRNDAIAVVRPQRDGSFRVVRAWTIDVQRKEFVMVAPQTVVCESLE